MKLISKACFPAALMAISSICVVLCWMGAVVPRPSVGSDAAEFNVTEESGGVEAAAASSGVLTITTYSGSDEGHLITFPDSTTMSIDCATGDITTKSHFHSDHCASCNSGQYNRNNVTPGQVIYSKDDVTVTVVAANGRVIGQASAGNIACDSNIENKNGMALWVKYGGFDYLTGGDLYGSVEGPLGSALKARGVHVDVLKINHHGTDTNGTSGLGYLQDISPEYATISGTETSPVTSDGKSYRDTIPNLIAAGVRTIYCVPDYNLPTPVPAQVYTANGNITITTDGCTYSFSGGDPYFYHGPYDVDEYATCDAPHLIVSEVAVSGAYLAPEDHRWVELYLPPGASSVDVSGLYWVSKDHKGRLAKNGPLTMEPGDVAIVHMTGAADTVYIDESNDTGKGANNWWDVSTHLDGNYWYTTDDCFMISKEDSLTPNPINIFDAVVWSNLDNSASASAVTAGNFLIKGFHWGDPVSGSGSFSSTADSAGVGSISYGYAQRITTLDTDSKADWQISQTNSQGTPPPTPTPVQTPTPLPMVDLTLNTSSPSAGETFTVSAVIQPITGRPFDAYAVIVGKAGVFSIQPGNRLRRGVIPIVQDVNSLPASYSGVLLNMRVPQGVAGDYRVIAGLVDTGGKVRGPSSAFAGDTENFTVK